MKTGGSSIKPFVQRVELTSGVTALVTPLEFKLAQALDEAAEEKYPNPTPPTEVIEAADGGMDVVTVTAGEAYNAYRKAIAEVSGKRAEFLLAFFFANCLAIEGADDEAGRAAIIEKYAPRLALYERLGKGPDEGEDAWDWTLRNLLFASADDYANLTLACRANQMIYIEQEEIAARLKRFRR